MVPIFGPPCICLETDVHRREPSQKINEKELEIRKPPLDVEPATFTDQVSKILNAR